MKGSRQLSAFAIGSLLLAGAAAAAPLQLVDAGGGYVTTPATKGNYLYVGTGSTLTTWNLSDASHPALASRSAPHLAGPLGGTVVAGNYLYATWYTTLDDGGILIYSLSDPAHPQLVAEVDDYVVADYKRPGAISAAGDHLFVSDADNGLVVLDMSNPLHPAFLGQASDAAADSIAVNGDRLFAFGRGWLGPTVSVVDISDPASPVTLGSMGLDYNFLRATFASHYAFATGNDLAVYDLSDPSNITQVFDTPIDTATQAVPHGNTLYLVGVTGIQVWDISAPAAPVLQRTVDLGAHVGFDVMQAADTPFGPVLLDKSTDTGLLVNVADPAHPAVTGSFDLPFGIAAHAAAFDATHVYFAQEDHGLSSLDASTLATLGQFRADLEDLPELRDFEDIAVEGTRAYIGAWGYGVIIVDIADPAHPVELGRFPFPYVAAIEVHDGRVYVSSTTNGGIFAIYDASNAANPQLLGSIVTSETFDFNVRGNYAYLVDQANFGDGGLRIVDVSNPAAPVVVGQDPDSCPYAGGVDVSADGNTVYVACQYDVNYGNSLQIVDTTDKSAPVLTGMIALPGDGSEFDYNTTYSVVVNDGTAYVGNDYGLDEIDVSTPAAPVWQSRHDTGYSVFKVEQAPDGRIFAFTQAAGTFVYAPLGDHIFGDGFDGTP